MSEASLNLNGPNNTNIIKNTSLIASISATNSIISQTKKMNSSDLHLDYSSSSYSDSLESSEQDNGLDSLTVAASVISSRQCKLYLIYNNN